MYGLRGFGVALGVQGVVEEVRAPGSFRFGRAQGRVAQFQCCTGGVGSPNPYSM